MNFVQTQTDLDEIDCDWMKKGVRKKRADIYR